METKLVCSDIDGTLLNKDRELSALSISTIKQLSPIPFILISSRMPQAMFHLQQELDITNLPMIAYNGALIKDQELILQSTEIDGRSSSQIAKFCSETSIHLSLYHNNEWYVPAMDYWAKREANNTKVTPVVNTIDDTLNTWESQNKGAHKIMCMGDELEIEALAQYIESNLKNKVIGYRSKPTYLEISPCKISKLTAIESLIKTNYPKTQLTNVVAFGDNYNDIDMLNAVGLGVAVENANSEAQQVADHITHSNKEDGVALFIKNHLLG
ncbi:MAG: haloacid dehalogenase [Bacteroidetes bacterium MedPE-SWsnd-G2]|nr:MAG: haloacid dehalogenase [Bacteroidetes bacterium MedPE-SWsnd-G2]